MSVEIRLAIAMINAGSHRNEVAAVVDAMERRGQPVTLVCLDRSRHDHAVTGADVLHVPLMSAAIASSLVTRTLRDPGPVFRTALRGLIRFPVAIHLAAVLQRRGITDVRGADEPSTKLASAVMQLMKSSPVDLSELPVDWSRLGVHRVGVRWFSKRINSIAAEVSVGEIGERLIVKRQRTHAAGTAAERWAHEYRVLSTLDEAMRDERARVPRILLADEDSALLVMERARGTALDALFAGGAQAGNLGEAIVAAGAWLAEMQSATPRQGDGRALLDELVSKAVEDARRLNEQRGIVERLQELKRRVMNRPLIVTGHHDDYWPGNIFFDGMRVTVIDFESFREGFPLEDVAYFLIRCDLLRRRFRVARPDLAERFFEGYSPGIAPDLDALRLFTLTKGLRTLARGIGDDLPMAQRIWTRRTIRRAVLRGPSFALPGTGERLA